MKGFLLLAACLAPGAIATAACQQNVCNADNCLRAITGTAPGQLSASQHIQGCYSYFSVTVYPATKTVYTAAATTYVVSQVGASLPPPVSPPNGPPPQTGKATTITATSLPAFALTACSPNSGDPTPLIQRYSSGCSCAGATHKTSTAPASVVTVGITVTRTISSFLIAASGAPLAKSEYLGLSSEIYGYENSNTLGFTSDRRLAAAFVVNDNQLEIPSIGILSDDDTADVTEPLFFDNSSVITNSGYAPVDITISQSLGVSLQNTANGNSIIEDCGGLLDIASTAGGDDVLGASCTSVSLTVIPL